MGHNLFHHVTLRLPRVPPHRIFAFLTLSAPMSAFVNCRPDVVRAGWAEGAPCRDEFQPDRESALVTVVRRRMTLPSTRHHGGHHDDHAE
jgi:hypothetical protein